jgi:hypothetical protein
MQEHRHMTTRQDQAQEQSPETADGNGANPCRSGEGSGSALRAMLKKRREGEHPEEADGTGGEPGSDG